METSEAVCVLNELSSPPGWAHIAVDWGHRQEGHVAVRLSQATYRTEREYWPNLSDHPVDARADFVFYVGDMTTVADLAVALTECYCDFHSHEVRECLRTPDGDAPIHPHTRRGQRAWSQCTGIPIEHDVVYGLCKASDDTSLRDLLSDNLPAAA